MSASTYISTARYANIVDLPICLPETELRRSVDLQIASFRLNRGQRAVLRLLNLNVLKVYTPGVIADVINSPFGWCYVGVFAGRMAASPLVYVATAQIGITQLNLFSEFIIASPGIYTVRVVNNTGKVFTSAMDFSVAVTGVIKFYA
jgi:hypothetical protein